MTTTIIRDSIVGDQWIQQTMAANPVTRIINQTTGQFTGDISTGPVRLAFEDLMELPEPTDEIKEPKYGSMLLFPPGVDFSIFYEEYYRMCAEKFASHYNAATQQYEGLVSPFKDQGEKAKFSGFTAGCVHMTCKTDYKPSVVDMRFNPIVDKTKVYPGAWAIVSVKPYAYGMGSKLGKKGVSFGLQSVMIIADDTKLAGGGPDAKQQFAHVKVSAPIARPNVNAMPQGAAPQGMPGISTRPPVAAPMVPLTHYSPPAPQAQDDDAELRAMGL